MCTERRRQPSLAEEARSGDRRALARLLTEIENRTAAGEEALRVLYPIAGAAHLVGVTGAPGSGKIDIGCRTRWRGARSRAARWR